MGYLSLADVLSLIVGFAAVMLLMSVLVLALVQATQATLRLRARNLQRGLQAVIEGELALEAGKGREPAAVLLNAPEIALLRRRDDPAALNSRLRGPIVSWLEPEDLRRAIHGIRGNPLKGAPSENEASAEKLKTPIDVLRNLNADAATERFVRLERYMSKRFGVAMRAMSLLWALLIALWFQVSTPALIKQLTTDPAYRARLAAAGEGITETTADVFTRLDDRTNATGKALRFLAERHPGLRSEISRVNADTNFPEGVSEDLARELESSPERATVVDEFEKLLNEQLEAERDAALGVATAAIGQLRSLDITPWRFGQEFYWRDGALQGTNVLGVLISVVLMSLGAPFWFNTLKSALTLRDTLAPRSKAPSTGPSQPKE